MILCICIDELKLTQGLQDEQINNQGTIFSCFKKYLSDNTLMTNLKNNEYFPVGYFLGTPILWDLELNDFPNKLLK